MGALIMAHSDDKGLVLPPKLAPIQVVIIPIYRKEEQLAEISKVAIKIKEALQAKGISVKFDDRDTYKPGWKFNEYEFKGIPVRLAIGPRDLENGTIEVARRDTLEKETYQITDIENKVEHILEQIQDNLFQRALSFREDNTYVVDSWDEFKDVIENKGGFVLAHWDGTSETEEKIKAETKATIRTIPMDGKTEEGTCVYSGKPSNQRVVFAKAY
jgi:prolyl-tRNA synthetase